MKFWHHLREKGLRQFSFLKPGELVRRTAGQRELRETMHLRLTKSPLNTARGHPARKHRAGYRAHACDRGDRVGAAAKFRTWNRAPAPSSAAGPAESARFPGCRARRVPRKGGRLRRVQKAGRCGVAQRRGVLWRRGGAGLLIGWQGYPELVARLGREAAFRFSLRCAEVKGSEATGRWR